MSPSAARLEEWAKGIIDLTSEEARALKDEVLGLRADRELWREGHEHDQAKIDRVRKYAEEREAYGRRGRTVHSARVASDLLAIVGVQ